MSCALLKLIGIWYWYLHSSIHQELNGRDNGIDLSYKKAQIFLKYMFRNWEKNSFWQEKNCKQKSFRISGSAVLLSTLSITIRQTLIHYKSVFNLLQTPEMLCVSIYAATVSKRLCAAQPLHLDLYTRGMWLIKYQPHFSVTTPTGHRAARVRSLTGAAVCSSRCSRAPCKVFVSHVFIMWASKQN